MARQQPIVGRRRAWRRVLVVMVALAAVCGVALVVVERVVRDKLEEVVRKAAGPGYQVYIGALDIDLLGGSAEVRNASLTFDSLRMDSLVRGESNGLLRVEADRITMTGLSYMQLVRSGIVAMRSVEIVGPRLDHYFMPRHEKYHDSTEPPPPDGTTPSLITLDTLRILGASGGTHDLIGERTSANVGDLDILSGGIVVMHSADGTSRFRARSTTLIARGVVAAFPPLYDLRIGSLELVHPAGLARATMASFTPRADAQHYGTLVPHETDLFHAKADTMLLAGVDVHHFLAAQELFIRRADVQAPLLVIHRDKTLPDGPFTPKRLPPAGLRALDRMLRIDTIAIHNGRVDYNERDSLNKDYGRVSFAELNAMLTGLGNTPELIAHGMLELEATARIYDKSTLRAWYRAPLSPTTSQFTVEAHLRSLPFNAFNRMTDSLLMVNVKSGRIDELVLRMHGNDEQAYGTLDLVYQDLDVELRSRDERQPRTWLLNKALQVLVRRDNLREARNYRQGTYTVVRRQDRSIFNYAWRAVRAGTLDSMVPGALSRFAQQKANKKARER